MDKEILDYAFDQTKRALQRLSEACEMPRDTHDIVLDATLQRFEFSYKMLCKLLRKLFASRAIRVTGAWSAFREAHFHGWIDSKTLWKQLIEDRNRTVHIYEHAEAIIVYERVVKTYCPAMQLLFERLQKEYAMQAWDKVTAENDER